MGGAGVLGNAVRLNPLYDDFALFDMYMSSLDVVLADPEIRAALDEFRLSPNALRQSLVADARQILSTATQEFAAYEAARGRLTIPDAAVVVKDSGSDLSTLRAMSRLLTMAAVVPGALFVVAGLASIATWRWSAPLLWAGATLLTVSGALMAFGRVLGTRPGTRLFRGELFPGVGPEFAGTRSRLMAAVGKDELVAQARTFINAMRQDEFGQEFSAVSISGLSEIYDTAYQVPTVATAELESLLTRLDGASIGIAGPRGSGKSTLIRRYCEYAEDSAKRQEARDSTVKPEVTVWRQVPGRTAGPDAAAGNLRCIVAAPVDYAPRDFVLHMFAVLCRSFIRWNDSQPKATFASLWVSALWDSQAFRYLTATLAYLLLPAVALLRWQRPLAGMLHLPAQAVFYTGAGLALLGTMRLARESLRSRWPARPRHRPGGSDKTIASAAQRHLAAIRYLQTYTSGWSGTLSLVKGSAQLSRGHTRAEQPRSYPEIVEEFRAFARDVAAHLHRNGHRAFIGIDELDKIGSPENAERFLNEIKGIFGIPHVYFLVSVSDDALTAFERRGLPLRDAFDSSFDEIVHSGQLNYAESRRLLYRRVIGLSEPYIALCHCLAGGLARDLIRAARQVIRVAEIQTGAAEQNLAERDDWLDDPPATYHLVRDERQPTSLTLSAVCAAVVGDEIRRKIRAIAKVANNSAPGDAQGLQQALSDIARQLQPGIPVIKIVDAARQPVPGETAAVTQLRLDFAAYAYYCATLQEIFTDSLTPARMVNATSPSSDPGTFDELAGARYAFTLDTHLAWHSISKFRQAWSLETRDLIKTRSGRKRPRHRMPSIVKPFGIFWPPGKTAASP